MTPRTKGKQDSRLQAKLESMRQEWGTPFLVYLFVRAERPEGLTIWAGAEQTASQVRQTVSCEVRGGRAELQWTGDSVSETAAKNLLKEMDGLRKADDLNWVVDYLHGSICQSLTAAHLHLELGLMDAVDPPPEFEMARSLLHESMVSLREFIDELSKDES